MIHRFIRIKDVDEDRKVLVENAIERYLVQLEETLTDVFQGTEREQKLMYSCLKEDNQHQATKSYTFMMILKEVHPRPIQEGDIAGDKAVKKMSTVMYSEMSERQRQESFWAKDFVKFTKGIYDPAIVDVGKHMDKIKFLETRSSF